MTWASLNRSFSAIEGNRRYPYLGWQNKNESNYENRIAPFRPILSPSSDVILTTTKTSSNQDSGLSSRDRASLFQMRGETETESRINSKFRESEIRNKLFPVRGKNEETYSVNTVNRGDLLPSSKPSIQSSQSNRKTPVEETNPSRHQESSRNFMSDEEIRGIKSEGNNRNTESGSKFRDDDTNSIRDQESGDTKFRSITPPNITNQMGPLPGANSNDANTDYNQLQNRVNLFETHSQNSRLDPNKDVSSSTAFLPTAPTFSIRETSAKQNIVRLPALPASSSSEESTIIQAIFQQVDGLNQDFKVKVINNYKFSPHLLLLLYITFLYLGRLHLSYFHNM